MKILFFMFITSLFTYHNSWAIDFNSKELSLNQISLSNYGKICLATKVGKLSYFASSKSYQVFCNDGDEFKTKQEVQILYIPTGKAERELLKTMNERGLDHKASVPYLLKAEKLTKYSPDYIEKHLLVFSESTLENKELIFVRRLKGKAAGPQNLVQFDFIISSNQYETEENFSEFNGYTESQFDDFFASDGYLNLLSYISQKSTVNGSWKNFLFIKED